MGLSGWCPTTGLVECCLYGVLHLGGVVGLWDGIESDRELVDGGEMRKDD